MNAIASQITSLRIVYSIVYSGADQSKHQSSASLAFVWGIHRGPVNSPHKWPVTRKMFPFDDVIMYLGLNKQASIDWYAFCKNVVSNLAAFRLNSLMSEINVRKQGKSEGFESCDRPIVRKRPVWVKIGDVLSHVTLKFDGWPWKTIGHLFFAVSSFVQHFIAISKFKLELQSGNAQFESNSTIFRAVWPWNLTDDLKKQ